MEIKNRFENLNLYLNELENNLNLLDNEKLREENLKKFKISDKE